MMRQCLHQFLRPTVYITPRDGCGNCITCQTDEENKNCLNYYGITVQEFIVKEKEEKR